MGFGTYAPGTPAQTGHSLLNVDYKDNQTVKNNQTEDTFRSVVQWRKLRENSKWEASAGYVYSDMLYEYMRLLGDDSWVNMVQSQSNTHSFSSVQKRNTTWVNGCCRGT